MGIYLGMPGYGKQTAGAGRALWRAAQDMDAVHVRYQQGSLLAMNFNHLWAEALTLAHQGSRVDYFAMLHDDVGVEDYWLDKLIVELEAHDLDVLGVVSPIKDVRGLTSLALHNEGDNWRPYARLTMHDVYRLPATFTSEHLGRPLLLNTGCWVCRFDPAWAKKVWFTVNDRIVFDKASNRYEPQCESEDWFFSRLCHELGLRLGATRKISLMHRGEMGFTNSQAWGNHVWDEHLTDRSPVPAVSADGFRWPWDVPGWLGYDEGKELWRLASGLRVLEIGSFCGLSTICLAQSAQSVLAMDWWDGRATPYPGTATLEPLWENARRYEVDGVIETTTPDADLRGQEFDLAFIDGAHDYESVKADVARAESVLSEDGLLVFHDYRSEKDPGVDQAVNEILEKGAQLVSTVESLAVVRPSRATCEV